MAIYIFISFLHASYWKKTHYFSTIHSEVGARHSAIIEGNQKNNNNKKPELLYTGDHSHEHIYNIVIPRDDTVKG